MVKAFALLFCAVGAAWLVSIFGFGMLVALAALMAGAVLLFADPAVQPVTHRNGPPTRHQTTGWSDF